MHPNVHSRTALIHLSRPCTFFGADHVGCCLRKKNWHRKKYVFACAFLRSFTAASRKKMPKAPKRES
jgi:hypothetical protein